MSLLSEAALNSLRAMAAGLLAPEEGTDREIELLGRTDTRDSSGQRVKGELTVLATVGGVLAPESASVRQQAGRPVGERTATLTLPYDTSLDGVVAIRIKGTGTVWEPLSGENNLDTSYRATTELTVRETRL